MASLRNKVLTFISIGFGLGRVPWAPGTAGTLLGVAIFATIELSVHHRTSTTALAFAFMCACAAAVMLGSWYEKASGVQDPPSFVLDEVAGFLLVVLLFRPTSTAMRAIWGFVASRAFDIAKPPPARQLARLPGGWGILADDIASALYAAGALHLLAFVAPGLLGATLE